MFARIIVRYLSIFAAGIIGSLVLDTPVLSQESSPFKLDQVVITNGTKTAKALFVGKARIPKDGLTTIELTEDVIKAAAASLQWSDTDSFQKTITDSTKIEIKRIGDVEDVVIQYSHPISNWGQTYRIDIDGQTGQLSRFVTVANDSPLDWNSINVRLKADSVQYELKEFSLENGGVDTFRHDQAPKSAVTVNYGFEFTDKEKKSESKTEQIIEIKNNPDTYPLVDATDTSIYITRKHVTTIPLAEAEESDDETLKEKRIVRLPAQSISVKRHEEQEDQDGRPVEVKRTDKYTASVVSVRETSYTVRNSSKETVSVKIIPRSEGEGWKVVSNEFSVEPGEQAVAVTEKTDPAKTVDLRFSTPKIVQNMHAAAQSDDKGYFKKANALLNAIEATSKARRKLETEFALAERRLGFYFARRSSADIEASLQEQSDIVEALQEKLGAAQLRDTLVKHRYEEFLCRNVPKEKVQKSKGHTKPAKVPNKQSQDAHGN